MTNFFSHWQSKNYLRISQKWGLFLQGVRSGFYVFYGKQQLCRSCILSALFSFYLVLRKVCLLLPSRLNLGPLSCVCGIWSPGLHLWIQKLRLPDQSSSTFLVDASTSCADATHSEKSWIRHWEGWMIDWAAFHTNVIQKCPNMWLIVMKDIELKIYSNVTFPRTNLWKNEEPSLTGKCKRYVWTSSHIAMDTIFDVWRKHKGMCISRSIIMKLL